MQFQRSADSKVIESVLSEVPIGGTVTYEALSVAIGRDVRTYSRGALQTARNALLRDKRMVFEVVRNVGLKRCSDYQIVQSTERDRRHLKKAATRAIRKLAAVEFANLNDEQKREHIVASAQLGAVEMFATRSAGKKIEAKVDGSSATLPIGETLKLFG